MIHLIVDEGYAFDYLAILSIKRKKSDNNYIELDFQANQTNIIHQIGFDKYAEVIRSLEYKTLVQANELVFDAVNKAKKNEISARTVDELNYNRYLAKKTLQEKFFNKTVFEQKI